MTIEFEAYAATGVLRGNAAPTGSLGDLLETFSSISLADAEFLPLDGGETETAATSEAEIDDLLAVIAPPDTILPIHAVWHRLALRTGPYEIAGRLPTLPGFDPERALARPSGTFVLLGSAEVRLIGVPSAGQARHGALWVNRYTVDQVEADIRLDFLFPGARSIVGEPGGGPAPFDVSQGDVARGETTPRGETAPRGETTPRGVPTMTPAEGVATT